MDTSPSVVDVVQAVSVTVLMSPPQQQERRNDFLQAGFVFVESDGAVAAHLEQNLYLPLVLKLTLFN